MSKPFKVLISGGGITGPVAAYWLARASTAARPIHITVIEKASATPKQGQGLDVEGPAREIVKRMGILETIQFRATKEKGFKAMGLDNRPYGIWGQGFLTQDIEIMRGELCGVVTEAAKAKSNVDFQYGRSITDIKQDDKSVRVTVSMDDGKKYEEEYSAVIACDGIRSSTRDLILDPSQTKDCLKTRDMYIAYFSVPARPEDGGYSRLQHSVGGRVIWTRPLDKDTASVYLIAVGSHPTLKKSLKQRGQKEKRQAWADAYSDVTYEDFPPILEEMHKTDNFYSDQITQVKLPTWSKGRCVLVGDAAFAPSPITGEGTQLAFYSAYILAGELGKNISNPAAAFEAYEKKLRAYVEESQEVPLGGRAPALICPQTTWGIRTLQTIVWLVSFTKVWNFARYFPGRKFDLPEYKFD